MKAFLPVVKRLGLKLLTVVQEGREGRLGKHFCFIFLAVDFDVFGYHGTILVISAISAISAN